MTILITGGGGFLGRRLADLLLADGGVDRIVLADVAPAAPHPDPRVEVGQADLSLSHAAESLVAGADVIFHLAAVVSGQAEADFESGLRVNLDATRNLLEAARRSGRSPRFVFTSSLAVFGPPLPREISDDTATNPQSSYGIQKAIGELLVSDYSRRGYIDGRAVRLPTVCVRPGRPNAAASSFVSGIIREPLAGVEAVCPVPDTLELWLSSPRAAVANLAHAARIPSADVGTRRIINLPGMTVTVAQMLETLGRVGGEAALRRVVFREDPVVRRIVSSWPSRFDIARAVGLGFTPDQSFEAIVRDYVGAGAQAPG